MSIAAAVKNKTSLSIALALLLSSTALASQAADSVKVLEAEQADVLKIDPPSEDWFYVRGGFGSSGTSIFDSKTGKMRGAVETSKSSDIAIDPSGKFYYISETIWTKGDRGTRQDMISVYDSTELKLQTEILVPGRIIIGGLKTNFVLSSDAKLAFVYNLSPASSVNVVDLVKRKFVRTIETPGCASLMPNPGVGFSALCSDGTLATVAVTGAAPVITHTAPFFAAIEDPIFSNFAYDKAKSEATFLSYTGLIYTAKITATPTVSKPFSIQEAAGARAGQTKPLDVNWYPGGNQPMALHRATGQLYVLMHMGEYWSHKATGTEIWVVDLASQKVVKRQPLETSANNIEVSQGATPMIFLNNREGLGLVLDAKTFEQKQKIERAGGGVITVVGPA